VGYNEWAQAYYTGLTAAAPRTAQRRAERALTGERLAAVRSRSRELHPCGIRGCTRTAYKGELCRTHWNMVPYSEKVQLQLDAMTAVRTVTRKHHRRFLRLVRGLVKEGER